MVAIGHKIIVAAYFIIKNKEPYKEPVKRNDPMSKLRLAKSHLKKLRELGFELSEKHLVPAQ